MKTLEDLLGSALQFFIVVIATLMILGQIGLDIGPAVAGLGVVGIAVGFGAQSMVRDYLTGALILVENQFGKGDVVRIAGVSGTVEDFTLRRTTLRDLDGVVHSVPNGEIKVASNLTRVWARINQDVTVAYGTDIDKAIEVVDGVGQAMLNDPVWKRRILEAPRVERVEALAEYGVTLKILGRRARGRPVGGGGRPAQAPARRVQGQRDRDPATAAGHPDPRRRVRPDRRGPAPRGMRRPGSAAVLARPSVSRSAAGSPRPSVSRSAARPALGQPAVFFSW